jgi:hypothetical protein
MDLVQIAFISVMTMFVLAVMWDEISGMIQNIPWGFMSFVLGAGSIYLGLKGEPLTDVASASVLGVIMGDVGGYNYYILAGAGFISIGLISVYVHYK